MDQITEGGLPRRRSTLVCGGTGCGKTILAAGFIVRGIIDYNEPGAFITFEERTDELSENLASLGFDLDELAASGRLFLKHVHFDPRGVVEIGEFDLEGLFAQVGHAIDTVEAKRVVIDGIETLFSFFSRESTVRNGLKRLLGWLKEKGVTSLVTAESGDNRRMLTRHGVEEYVSDCVIFLDQRIQEQVATRRLHIYKYRGARHGTNEYPFIIVEHGLKVLPITSTTLDAAVCSERVGTGIDGLDKMFGGKGFYKGSSVLISGTAGTGKSSFAAQFAVSVCRVGGRCRYLAFEESAAQIVRNMGSIGLDLKTPMTDGLLLFYAVRPTVYGLERHLLQILQKVEASAPDAVVIDPISNLTAVGSPFDITEEGIMVKSAAGERSRNK